MNVLPWVATYRRSAGASSAMLGMLRIPPTNVPNPVAGPWTTRSMLKEVVGVGFIDEIRARLPPSVKKSLLPGVGGALLPPPPPPPQLVRVSKASASAILVNRLQTASGLMILPYGSDSSGCSRAAASGRAWRYSPKEFATTSKRSQKKAANFRPYENLHNARVRLDRHRGE